MKKILGVLLILTLLLCCTALAENHIETIDIDVLLNADGSAVITQEWRGSFREGTECYIPINDSGYLTIEDLSVYCDGTAYQTVSEWNENADLEDKANLCGIKRVNSGYEICWGISSYDDHDYRISYRVNNFVRGYNDADGFNFMFVNKGMNTVPTDVTLFIHSDDFALNDQNAGIWGFGFNGEVGFAPQGAYAITKESLTAENSVIVMMRIKQGLLMPTMYVDQSFDDVISEAQKNSDYKSDVSELLYPLIPIGGIAAVAVVISVIVARKRKRALDEIAAQYRNEPFDPKVLDMLTVWRLTQLFRLGGEEGGIIGALLMRLMRTGCLCPAEAGTMGKEAGKTPLRMVHEPDNTASPEGMLYDLLKTACDEYGLLDPKYVKKCFKRHPNVMRELLSGYASIADQYLNRMRCFAGPPCGKVKQLTENGRRAVASTMRLKAMLTDYNAQNAALLADLSPEDCVTYALLFGLKDSALDTIRRFYPNHVPDDYWMSIHTFYWCSWYYRDYSYGEMRRAEQARSGGSGGKTSIGGGGGFSGGGHGGGTR